MRGFPDLARGACTKWCDESRHIVIDCVKPDRSEI